MDREKLRETLGLMGHQLDNIVQIMDDNARSILTNSDTFLFSEKSIFQKFKESFEGIREEVDKTWVRGKVVAAQDYIFKLTGHMINMANQNGVFLSITTRARGQIPQEMVEQCSKTVIAAMERSLYLIEDSVEEMQKVRSQFLCTPVLLDMTCDDNGFDFSIYTKYWKLSDKDDSKFIRAIRKEVSSNSGWYLETTGENNNLSMKSKIPFKRSVFDSHLVTWGAERVFLPDIYLRDVIHPKVEKYSLKAYFRLHPDDGLVFASKDDIEKAKFVVVVCVADYVFGILCSDRTSTHRTRSVNVREYLEEDSWYKRVGASDLSSNYLTCPLLEGELLLKLYSQNCQDDTAEATERAE